MIGNCRLQKETKWKWELIGEIWGWVTIPKWKFKDYAHEFEAKIRNETLCRRVYLICLLKGGDREQEERAEEIIINRILMRYVRFADN